MFCPQCRLSWPKGSAGTTNLSKMKRKTPQSPAWGNALLCPNCLVPLAADRIQGEFPSVAHASSTKEGAMTVKDVLRESGVGGPTSGDVPLDDKPNFRKFRLFERDANGKRVIASEVRDFSRVKRPLLQRLSLAALALFFCSIIAIGARTIFATTPKVQKTAAAVVTVAKIKRSPAGVKTLSANELSLLKLMPAAVGKWKRIEAVADVWKDDNLGNGATHTFVSTYKLGSARVELWATKLPLIRTGSPLRDFEGGFRAVHTDFGVIDVMPRLLVQKSAEYMVFDYSGSSPNDWILANQSYQPELPHTISWYASPYIVTAASRSKQNRDDFVKALSEDAG